MCPPGQDLVQYTSPADSSSNEFQIIVGSSDQTTTLLAPSPDGGVFQDGTTEISINLLPTARMSNIIMQLKVRGAESVTFKYVISGVGMSQSQTVSIPYI